MGGYGHGPIKFQRQS